MCAHLDILEQDVKLVRSFCMPKHFHLVCQNETRMIHSIYQGFKGNSVLEDLFVLITYKSADPCEISYICGHLIWNNLLRVRYLSI